MVLAELGGKLRDALRKVSTSLSNSSSTSSSSSSSLTPEQITSLLSDIARALIEADVNVKLVLKLRTNLQQRINKELEQNKNNNNPTKWIQSVLMEELVALLTPSTTTKSATDSNNSKNSSSSSSSSFVLQRNRCNIVLFVGLQGAGKTTTIAKYAHYYQKRGWKIAMVCADTFRAGALDQLKQNATKLRIPFYGSYTQADPVVVATEGVAQFRPKQQQHETSQQKQQQQQQQKPKSLTKKKTTSTATGKKSNSSFSSSSSSSVQYELILVDTSGRHQQEASLLEEMQEISAAIRPNVTILVMDATQGQAVYDQASAFAQAVPVGSVILTKLDGHAKGGGALSAVAATGAPISFLATGEHFDDLELFSASSFCSKLLGLGDVRGFMEAIQSASDTKSQQALLSKVQKGEGFTLRDMYQQFQGVLNMGPLDRVMGMLPGMPEYLMGGGGGGGAGAGSDEATMRLKRFLYIMDSMTNAELDGKVPFVLAPTMNPSGGTAAAGTAAAVTSSSSSSSSKSIIPSQQLLDATQSRIRRIAAGSGTSPNDVQMLLMVHSQMSGVYSKVGKSGMLAGAAGGGGGGGPGGGGGGGGPGDASAMGMGGMSKQQQQMLAQQLRKNPNLLHQRLNQMDPRLIQQMGGRDHVLQVMQQMAKGGSGSGSAGGGGSADATMMMMPPSPFGGAAGAGPGGVNPMMASMMNNPMMASMMNNNPMMSSMMNNPAMMNRMMQQFGGGGGGGAGAAGGGGAGAAGAGGFPGLPPGMDMEQLMKMAQAMGMAPPGAGGGAAAGMPPMMGRR